ncbi:hypothetical protein [Halorubrum salinum]|uniref:hypothetical protein n=1 Tax=Halorubrum salinum TaxID=767517 RepID=UPI002111BFBE|nr:hypothetical protein [Halorubrum salinum]
MADNEHAGMVAHQLAKAAADGDEPRVVEVPITLHRNKQGLHAWIDEEALGEETVEEISPEIDMEEIERRLFNRFPEVLLQNAEENLTPEWCRDPEDAPQVASADFYPDVGRLGGVAIAMDQRLQWAMIPRVDGGESA